MLSEFRSSFHIPGKARMSIQAFTQSKKKKEKINVAFLDTDNGGLWRIFL